MSKDPKITPKPTNIIKTKQVNNQDQRKTRVLSTAASWSTMLKFKNTNHKQANQTFTHKFGSASTSPLNRSQLSAVSRSPLLQVRNQANMKKVHDTSRVMWCDKPYTDNDVKPQTSFKSHRSNKSSSMERILKEQSQDPKLAIEQRPKKKNVKNMSHFEAGHQVPASAHR